MPILKLNSNLFLNEDGVHILSMDLQGQRLHTTRQRLAPFTSQHVSQVHRQPGRSPCPIHKCSLHPSFGGSKYSSSSVQRAGNRRKHRARGDVSCSVSGQVIGWGLFFTPGLLAVTYAFVRGKGNVRDGLSRLLTDISQGYFQPDVGGETIPVAQGELSDLVGGEPLFKALFQWWVVSCRQPCCYTRCSNQEQQIDCCCCCAGILRAVGCTNSPLVPRHL